MKINLTLFVAVLAVALSGVGCGSFQTTEIKLKNRLVPNGHGKLQHSLFLIGVIYEA